MSKKTGLRILVAPLDWGLGHTTRCVPLIKALRALGHSVIAAGNDAQLSFIKNIYDDIETVFLPGYDIAYSHSRNPGSARLVALLPKIYRAIKAEHGWLATHLKALNIDGIISDNRYGLYANGIPSVILTHQLEVQTGMGRQANRVAQKIHYRYLQQFDEVWVPDVQQGEGLAGRLAHPDQLPANVQYIGLLSQFQYNTINTDHTHLLILLSGPEPQRTMLDDLLWAQACKYPGKVVFISGSTAQERNDIPAHIEWYNRVGGEALERLIQAASAVVCRSGYSTIMDLVLLNKPALLIPTPGQTEQDFLARQLSARGIFTAVAQNTVDMNNITLAGDPGSILSGISEHYNDHPAILAKWVDNIAGKKS